MPYYLWCDNTSGKSIEIQRRIRDIDIPPYKEEIVNTDITIEEFAEADWERKISESNFIGEKGKGNW